MLDHTTHPQGRDSLTPNKFTWRFLALSRTDRKAKPCRLSVEAATEREARRILAPHFILSLAARLPLQGIEKISTPSTMPQDRHYESFVGQPFGDSLAFWRRYRLTPGIRSPVSG